MPDKRASSDRRTGRKASPTKARSLERSPLTARQHAPRKPAPSRRADHREKLRARLKTAEETLAAIQSGEVDALMVQGRRGEQVVALQGGEPAYRMLVEAM